MPGLGSLDNARGYGVSGGWMRVEELLELEPDGADNQRPRLRIVQLLFGLALKLRIDHEEVNDGNDAFTDVVCRDLELGRHQVVRFHVRTHRASDSIAQALFMRPAIACGDAVDRSEEHTSELQSRGHIV